MSATLQLTTARICSQCIQAQWLHEGCSGCCQEVALQVISDCRPSAPYASDRRALVRNATVMMIVSVMSLHNRASCRAFFH